MLQNPSHATHIWQVVLDKIDQAKIILQKNISKINQTILTKNTRKYFQIFTNAPFLK